MIRNELTSAKDIEDISFDILKGSKALGIFPTPIDQIVQYAELRVNEKRDLSVIPKNYIGKSTEEIHKIKMNCPNCGSKEVYPEEGYATVFRCHKCGRIGNTKDFGEDDNGES